jgi:ribonuclease R
LRVPHDQTMEVKRAIKRLVRDGQLQYESNHLVRAATPLAHGANRVLGVFRRTQGGFGFVRRSKPAGEQPGGGAEPAPDVYVAAGDSRDAASGDVVLVHITSSTGRGGKGPAGEIVEIVERDSHEFVGTYFENEGMAYVQVDGTVFAKPIYVGDPGAKGARADDKVVIEMVRFPSPLRDGEGVISEVLGPRGKPGVDTLSIIREFHLPEKFAADALEEARLAAEAFTESIPEGRLDLTRETIVTIDPIDARDFDDAISLERLPSGNWHLGVHIADVSHFVQPKTALDREARERGTSVYLPDRVIPMLPEIVSNGLASLQPGKVRYTKSAFIEFSPEGTPLHTEFFNSAIASSKRLTYEQVDEFLADREAWRRKLPAKVHELLGRMHELAMILRSRRRARGSLELAMREVKVDLDPHGRVAGAHVVENTESHQIIEAFMLAANEAVAAMLDERELPFLRRVHKAPDERKLAALTEFINELGFRVGSLRDRFALQKLLEEVAGKPEQQAVNYSVLRSLQRAVYSPEEEGHYALASDTYCHFTSPIRRYPDLIIHRQLTAILAGHKPAMDFDELVVLGQHCSELEQRAEVAERELTKTKLMAYMSQRIGEELDGVITGVESFGLFVQGLQVPAEGFVPIITLSDDFYQFDRKSHTLSGRRAGNVYRLGDLMRVVVSRVDLERREMDFRPVGHQTRPAPKPIDLGSPRRPSKAKAKPKTTAKAKVKSKPKAKRKGKGRL